MDSEFIAGGDMSPADFRRHADPVVEWIARYFDTIDGRPVGPRVAPGEVAAQLPADPPREPEPMRRIIEDFDRIVAPNLVHWNHPAFFGYFPASASLVSVLGDALASALSVNAMLWKTAPAASEVEAVVADWLRRMLGLPDAFRGTIGDSASNATMVAIAAAREQVPGLEARRDGLAGRPDCPRLVVYASDQVHSSVEKAAIVLGIGQRNVRKIRTDDAFRMDPRDLERQVAEDRAGGAWPFCVVSTAGTTSTASIDPIAEIAKVCRRHGLWHHLDGAYGLMAAIVPEYRFLFRGVEEVDSLVTNPHKWLFNPLECSAFYARRPELIHRVFRLVPDYLTSTETGVDNAMDWGLALGRRFRSLKLWMVIRHFGVEGLAERLRRHVGLAHLFADRVAGSPSFELMAPVSLSTVCFRARPAGIDEPRLDALNARLLDRVNLDGGAYLSSTRLRGTLALRLAVGNIRTEERHVLATWDLLESTLRSLDLEPASKNGR